MGGPGSGRTASTLAQKKMSDRVRYCYPISWRVIEGTLAQAARQLEKPEGIDDKDWKPPLPAANVLTLAQWVVEMKDGKPTVKVDQHNTLDITLSASEYLEAARKARIEGQRLLASPERGAAIPEHEGSHKTEIDDDSQAQNESQTAYCATLDTPGEGGQVIEAEYRVTDTEGEPGQLGSGMPL